MKKILSLILSLCMLATMSVCAFAEDYDVSVGTAPVCLSSTVDGSLDGIPSPTAMSVTVPTSLPMAMADDGTVVTASGCRIVNHSYGAVRVKSAEITAVNGWSLTAFGEKSILANEKVDSNLLGFALSVGGGPLAVTDHSDPISQMLFSKPMEGCYLSGEGNPCASSVSVDYSAIVTPLSYAVTNACVAEIVFVIEWDTAN